MQGFTGQAEPIRALAGPTARALARTLVVAASGLDNVREGQGYIENLLGPMIGRPLPACALLSPQQVPVTYQSQRIKYANYHATFGTDRCLGDIRKP